MRQKARVDENQSEIVEALRKAGCSIGHLHTIGQGYPDVVIGAPGLTLVGNFSPDLVSAIATLACASRQFVVLVGANVLLEIKMPDKRLTPDEEEWHENWKGQVMMVHSAEEALSILGKMVL